MVRIVAACHMGNARSCRRLRPRWGEGHCCPLASRRPPHASFECILVLLYFALEEDNEILEFQGVESQGQARRLWVRGRLCGVGGGMASHGLRPAATIHIMQKTHTCYVMPKNV